MYAKIEITGIIEVVTGLHIGGSSAFSAIGAVDSPVIKDMQTQHPMIPGSSLKGPSRPFAFGKFKLDEGRDSYTLQSADIGRAFEELAGDM